MAAGNAGGGGVECNVAAFVGDSGGERIAGPQTSTLGVVGCGGVLLRCVVDKANGCCCGGGKSTAIRWSS